MTEGALERDLRRIVEPLRASPGPLLVMLHAVQDTVGYIPGAAVAVIADVLNLSRAEVHGVLTFYHHFRTRPRGKHVVQVCRAESCQAMNGDALAVHIVRKLGVEFGETSADGAVTLEPVYCLGHCACSPAIALDDQPYGRMSPERFDELITSTQV